MKNIEYFKLQAKNLHKDYKTRKLSAAGDIYEYSPKYYDITSIFLEYGIFDDDPKFEFSLMNAQHLIAKLVGFNKWDDLIKASDTQLEIAKIKLGCFSFDNYDPSKIEDYEFWVSKIEEENHTKCDDETLLTLAKYYILGEEMNTESDSKQRLISQFYETIGNKIKGNLLEIIEGPIVHNFIFEPDKDTKQKNIKNIIKDTPEVMVTYGKQINFQIPKQTSSRIWLKDLIKTTEWENTDAVLPMIMGVDTFGKTMIKDLRKMPHMLVVGRTGSGKTMLLNCILNSLKSKLSPTECKFIIIDPRSGSYDSWNKDKYLLDSVITDVDIAIKKTQEILQIMNERYQILQANNVKNIEEYNKKTNKNDMPYIVVTIDEIADLMYTDKKQTEMFVMEIARRARAVGIHLILATHRPEQDVLTGVIKANMPTIIVFKARTPIDSVQILGEQCAEKLIDNCDMLFSEAGLPPVRIHSAFLQY